MTLNKKHQKHLEGSAISPEVIEARGYESIGPPYDEAFKLLRDHKIPNWARNDDKLLNGILIPTYRVTGEQTGWQYRPDVAPKPDGKPRKYADQKGEPSRLDLHPSNTDRIKDIEVPVWITEGVKKADALTTAGQVAIALRGVFNWRNKLGTLGDWEDVPLKGRTVYLCFDSDALTNMNVARAMGRLGKWLRSKGAKPRYIVVPTELGAEEIGLDKVGADDYLAAGGTIEGLIEAATDSPPNTANTDDTFSDARMADTASDELLVDNFVWSRGLGWLRWDGMRWAETSEESVVEEVRVWVLDQFKEALDGMRTGSGQADNANRIDGWRAMLSKARIKTVVELAKGKLEQQADEFDTDPDLLNTPAGVVDLRDGSLSEHDPQLWMTKITKGSYRPGHTHPDWEKALTALDSAERSWLQRRVGQAATGHPTPDGILPVLQGGGENGKSAILDSGVVKALGDYASAASAKLFLSTKGNEHSTEMADLRGQRLMLAEEIAENRSIDVTSLKRIQDVETIKARYIRKDNIQFDTTHSLFTTSNYEPVVNETDHGTWRRLALLVFPYRFRKPDEPQEKATDRPGDPTLKSRIKTSSEVADAVVTWVVEGAVSVADNPDAFHGYLTPKIKDDTRRWRKKADRILGFWDELLVADREKGIVSTDLFQAFNDWLKSNGHHTWPQETFSQRFGGHQETARHGVELRQTKKLDGVVDLYVSPSDYDELDRPKKRALPGKARVWLGVRFATDSDTPEESPEEARSQGSQPSGISLAKNSLKTEPRGVGTFGTSDGSASNGDASDDPDWAEAEFARKYPDQPDGEL